MSDFMTPPRGNGRGWRDGNTVSGFVPRYPAAEPEEDYYPPEDDPTSTNPGLYRVPQPGDPEYVPTHQMPRAAAPPRELLVPRVPYESDPVLSGLRKRAIRWAVFRDIVVISVGCYLLSAWVVIPLWHTLFG
jgi:hypothetical protein